MEMNIYRMLCMNSSALAGNTESDMSSEVGFGACLEACLEHGETGSREDVQRRSEHPPAPARSVAHSADSGASVIQHFELAFQLEKDSLRFQMFTIIACVAVYLYSIASCSMFFSSLYPVMLEVANATALQRTSAVDSFLMTSHVFAIDSTSAVFVVTGFFAAYIFANVPTHDRRDMCKMFAIYVLIDVWLSGLLAVISGSIYHLLRRTFQPRDVALTVIESIFCLRALEFEQDSRRWHSMNPSAWPVMCIFWGTLLTPLTLGGNERLRLCHPNAGVVIPWVNACAPILIISLFALVHDNTNIFYINAANVGYRVLEFNLGICLYSTMTAWPVCFWKIASVVGNLCAYVLVVFVTLWWAQLGTSVSTYAGTCIRMYNFSPCIEMHHGFLMRGCFLGATLVSRVVTSSEDAMRKVVACVAPLHPHALTTCLGSVLLTWPVCYVVHLVLEINFGLQLVRDNAALLTLVVPHVVFALALLWDTSWKSRVFLVVESFIDRALCAQHG
jgi:hypothetical protein